MTCHRTTALGAYVLGALERWERAGLEAHLETCEVCREELDRLAPLPGLLSRLTLDEAEVLATAGPGPAARGDGGGGPAPLTAAASDHRTGVHGAAELTPEPWGTRVELRLAGVRPGQRCRLVARSAGGRSEVAATWRAGYLGTAEVPGAVAIPAERLTSLDVVTPGDRVLVRMPVTRR
jgi:anti-sigma factor RsiW